MVIPAPFLCNEWHFKGGSITAPPFRIAGIVNITPDSFSDGGLCFAPSDAIAQAKKHLAHGADFLDIGAESTRPGAIDIGSKEEIRRFSPVIDELVALKQKKSSPSFVLCLDTFRAASAKMAIDLGVQVINDISGGLFEPAILDLVAEQKVGYVLGHSPQKPQQMQDNPQYNDVVDSLLAHFESQMKKLTQKGLPEEYICLDPCIGFGKTLAHTIEIFQNIHRLQSLGRPLYFGISNKSFIGTITHLPVTERTCQTQVSTALLAERGVAIHRVHDVKEAKATLRMVEQLGSGS